MVLIRKQYLELKADRFRAKMKFRRTMRDEMMQKAPGMRYGLFLVIFNLILSLQICCWRAGKEEEEKEAKSNSCPWKYEVGVVLKNNIFVGERYIWIWWILW
jgi:hypothetical protein